MSYNLKKNDIIVAIDPCIMKHSKKAALTVGRKYIINDIDYRRIIIIDDQGDSHQFQDKDIPKYFNISKPEIKIKLKFNGT